MILAYMRNKGVNISQETTVTCLVPRNKDKSTLTFLSFKIDTDAIVAQAITSDRFWPRMCTIKNFIHKSIVNLTGHAVADVNFLDKPPTNVTIT